MKKLIYAVFAALLALSFTACGNLGQPSEDNTQSVTYGNVTYGYENGNITGVTLPLDGRGTNRSAARAISKDIANELYDFFEVVFFDGTNVARASWDINKSMNIGNVPRGDATYGIDYGEVYRTTHTPGGGIAADEGTATLFVGKTGPNGLTLLAIGKVLEVDNVSATIVKASSRSVTFGLAAFVADTSPSSGSSFQITSATSMTPARTPILLNSVPVLSSYNLNKSAIHTTTYTLGSSAPSSLPASDMVKAARINGTPNISDTFKIRVPSLSMGKYSVDFTNIYQSGIISATGRSITLGAAGSELPNPISINFSTTATEGVTSLYFDIPVYAITTSTTNVSGSQPVSQKWFVRPGINPLSLDAGNMGACILISNGMVAFDSYSDDGLKIIYH